MSKEIAAVQITAWLDHETHDMNNPRHWTCGGAAVRISSDQDQAVIEVFRTDPQHPLMKLLPEDDPKDEFVRGRLREYIKESDPVETVRFPIDETYNPGTLINLTEGTKEDRTVA